MEDLLKELIFAKTGDLYSAYKIIKRLEKLIEYQMTIYNISDKKSCYDQVARRIVEGINKFIL